MILFLILAFALLGTGTGLMAYRFMPRVVPDRPLPLALFGAAGGLAGGLSSLVLFGYGRAHDYLSGYTGVYEGAAETLPAYWMSPLFALVGALLVLAVYRLVRSRLTTH